MTKLMLIDATHAEETRVAVVKNGQIEDFDFEARAKRQLRGNIYLAKVTRVEPSLQAAFVDYGGNRHGFLAFAEIHPDYYQIPKEDRDALMAEAAAAEQDYREPDSRDDDDPGPSQSDAAPAFTGDNGPDGAETDTGVNADSDSDGTDEDDSHADSELAGEAPAGGSSDEDEEEEDDSDSEAAARRRAAIFQRKYRIQEVIRRRQVLLVQVVKEERGNKGAALTSYLSLAGRYCVLMPNTSRAGGVSRKITNAADRKRLKDITSEFEIPRGAGLIVRTAGAKRTKIEIRRDFEYLTRLWKQIVDRTMESMAPCLIHEEGHLVLRAVRDLYDKDVERIIVDGKAAFEEVRTYVDMLMPSHSHKVVQHEEGAPLFVSTGVEDQLDSIFSPTVQLPSGGYVVINQTEALVAVDVNSGRATRERNVESTAVRTNLEAAAEVCRQMRLRDLAGLIVIDFIDMEDSRNIRSVERRMADCLRIDRARVQTGRISQFGLFEISRQRRRAGVLELSSEPCPHCAGTGRVRSVESAALQVLRAVEARAADDAVASVSVQAPSDVALYILNEKRAAIAEIESRTGIHVRVEANGSLKPGEVAIDGRDDEGEIVPHRPAQAISIGRLKPLAAPEHLEEEGETDFADASSAEEDDLDEDEDEDEDAEGGARRSRGRRGGRRRRVGRDGATGSEPRPQQAAEGERERHADRDRTRDRDAESGRRGRRRRGRENRNRTPDIAADGGEMLDAIASAPFLGLEAENQAGEQPVPFDSNMGEPAPTQSAPAASVPTFGRTRGNVTEVAPFEVSSSEEPQEAEPVEDLQHFAEVTPRPDLETAASSADHQVEMVRSDTASPAPIEPALIEPALIEPALMDDGSDQAAQAARHPIHGSPETPAPAKEDKPRRIGWWNRKKAG